MSYTRVIPRDLFNEGNLLKCLGQLYLNLEKGNYPNVSLNLFTDDETGTNHFDVRQDSASGNLYVSNIECSVNGDRVYLERPLNSKQPYPLFLLCPEQYTEVQVFDDQGGFTSEMERFLQGSGNEENLES